MRLVCENGTSHKTYNDVGIVPKRGEECCELLVHLVDTLFVGLITIDKFF